MYTIAILLFPTLCHLVLNVLGNIFEEIEFIEAYNLLTSQLLCMYL
jgi:hypothetical protein